jgi:hypothetical protein
MLAQCVTAVALFGAGDIIAQQVVEKKGRNHDVSAANYGVLHLVGRSSPFPFPQFMRTARLSFYGGKFSSLSFGASLLSYS